MPAPVPVPDRSRHEVLRAIAAGVLPALTVAAAVAAVSGLAATTTFADTFRDPSVTLGFSPLLGGLSALGVMLWSGAAALGLGGGLAGRTAGARPALVHHLLLLGVLSGLLAIDDQFVVHEWVGGDGGGQHTVLLAYGAVLTGVLLAGRSARAQYGGSGTLLVALVLLGASVAVDGVALFPGGEDLPRDLVTIVEDTAKLAGIAVWVLYVGGLARALVPSQDARPQEPTALATPPPAGR